MPSTLPYSTFDVLILNLSNIQDRMQSLGMKIACQPLVRMAHMPTRTARLPCRCAPLGRFGFQHVSFAVALRE